MKNFGGLIVSTGFEVFANVWGPENLFGEAHIGKLKGHKYPILGIDCNEERPFVFTIDQKNEIIIWDIRNLSLLQLIQAPGKNEKLCHGLINISNDVFWAFGTRFISYDKQENFDGDQTAI